ncbi:hypothetical protein KY289_015040 [Solanum tuberosum]|nr:hypothetical protein KY289_015040 [Solanum tuberosum]KAH0701385.1 hypothetical protein KY284_015600 [Solanum tuberosum]
MYRSPPRPLPYDADPRYFRLQRDGLVSRREKGSSHSHEETEPLRRSDIDDDSESLGTGNKWKESVCEEGSKEYNSKSLKLSTAKTTTEFTQICYSSEDEDVCPTCLEEYTEENPKIMTKCSHHFHLGCIYEWMERSDNCPVCGKVVGKRCQLVLWCASKMAVMKKSGHWPNWSVHSGDAIQRVAMIFALKKL